MISFAKYTLAGVAGALVLLLLVAVLLDFGIFKNQLVTLATEAISRDVAIDGDLSIRFGREIRVEASDLRLAAPEWSTETQMASVGRVEGQVSLASVIDAARGRGPALITGLVVSDAEVALETSTDGQHSWDFELGEESESADDTVEDTTSRPRIPVLLDDTQLADIRVSYRSAEGSTADIAITKLTQSIEEERVVTQLDGAVNNTPLTLGLTGRSVQNILNLKSIGIDIEGRLGDIELDGELFAPNLLSPRKPQINLGISGPSFEYLTTLLGLPEISRGPLNINVSTSELQERMQFTLDGRLGEYLVQSTGQFDDLSSLDYASLNVTASGPNARNITDLLDLPQAPALPFAFDTKLARDGYQLEVDATRLTVGRTQLDIEGEAGDFRKPSTATANFNLLVPTLETFTETWGLPEGFAGELMVTATLAGEADGASTSGTMTTPYGSVTFNGDLTDTEGLTGSQMHLDANWADLQELLSVFDAQLVTQLPDNKLPVNLQADLTLNEQGIAIDDAIAKLGPDQLRVAGDVGFTEGSSVDFQFSGQRLETWLPPEVVKQPLPEGFSFNGRAALGKDSITLDQLDVALGDTNAQGRIVAALDGSTATASITATSPGLQPLITAFTGRDPGELIPLNLQGDVTWTPDAVTIKGVEAKLARGDVRADGVVHGAPEFTGTDLDLDVNLDDLSLFSALAGTPLPKQSLQLTGNAVGDDKILRLPELTLVTGNSQLKATAVLDYRAKPNFDLAISGPRLDLRPFLSEEEKTTEPIPKNKGAKADGRLIPDIPLNLSLLAEFDGEVNIDVAQMDFSKQELKDFELIASLSDGELDVSSITYQSQRGGSVNGRAHVMPRGERTRAVVNLKGHNMVLGLLARVPEEIPLVPRFQLDTAFVGEGTTLRELIGGLNGYFRIDVGKGQVASGLLSGVTNDFVTSLLQALNPIREKKQFEALNCVAVMTTVEDGKIVGDPAVVFDTDQLNITAGARVDLATERLKVNFKTVPKKGVGIGISNLLNPFIQVSGTLAKPSLNLDAKNAIIESGKQVATGGMFFVAETLLNRVSLSDKPCEEALQAADEEFSALRSRYDEITE